MLTEIYYGEDKQAEKKKLRYLVVPVEAKSNNRMAVVGTPYFLSMTMKAEGIKPNNPSAEIDNQLDPSTRESIQSSGSTSVFLTRWTAGSRLKASTGSWNTASWIPSKRIRPGTV